MNMGCSLVPPLTAQPQAGGLEERNQVRLVVHNLPDKLFSHRAAGLLVIPHLG
jgi:hypothetical protein